MKYPIEQLENDISDYIAETAPLRKTKGHDYAGDYDIFDGLRSLGVDYCLKRIIQKCWRCLNLLEKLPAVQDEPLEAEFSDIANFALYSPILHKQIKQIKERKKRIGR